MSLHTALIITTLLLGSLTAFATDSDGRGTETPGNSPSSASMPIQSPFLQGIAKAKFDALLRYADQGTITGIHVKEGEWVKAGTPLLTIDDNAARAAMIVAKASAEAHAATDHAQLAMKQAQTIVTRTRIALHANAASEFELQSKENQLDQATANYELQVELQKQAQAQLALAEEQLKKRTLSAPFDGRVIQIHAGLGNTIDPTQVAVHVAKLNELEVEMHLPVSLFGTIEAGETRQLRASAPVNGTVAAKVIYVAPIVEPTSATFRVVFAIDNEALTLPAGFEVWYQQN